MKGIFVNSSEYPYAERIVSGFKTIETRSKNMLRACVGDRVAIVRTGKGIPVVIGYVTVSGSACSASLTASDFPGKTYVFPGSKFANNRWFYFLKDAEMLSVRFPLPADTVRHGRSWCEFELEV